MTCMCMGLQDSLRRPQYWSKGLIKGRSEIRRWSNSLTALIITLEAKTLSFHPTEIPRKRLSKKNIKNVCEHKKRSEQSLPRFAPHLLGPGVVLAQTLFLVFSVMFNGPLFLSHTNCRFLSFQYVIVLLSVPYEMLQ